MRRFRTRLLVAFVVIALLVGLGTLALALSPWRGVQALLVGGLIAVAAGLAVRAVIGRLSRPVELLTEATRRFGQGELSHRIQIPQRLIRWRRRRRPRSRPGARPHPGDELLDLALAWNDMAARIESLVTNQRELLAHVSHDLRSPLTRIRLALELLPQSPENAGRLSALTVDLDELDRLVDDVLTVSRLDATGLPTHLAPVDLAGLCAELAARAALDPTFAGAPPSVSCPPLTLVADPALLRRALWNLLENAARHGTPPVTLTVQDGDPVLIVVEDAGPGVPEVDRARLFEPFFRGDRARTGGPARGSGLGLSIARRIARVHGGELDLVPSARGARFELSLPRS